MQALNYCRQARYDLTEKILPRADEKMAGEIHHLLSAMQRAVKFIMPNGGRIFADKQLRGLDENQTLRLPFPTIVLEYSMIGFSNIRNPDQTESCTKRIVIAQEDKDHIFLRPVLWFDKLRTWTFLPECALPVTGYLVRNEVDATGKEALKYFFYKEDSTVPEEDYGDEIEALLSLLNALACSNVRTERIEPAKPDSKLKKGALPFDSYQFLTVDVTPRDQKTGEAMHGGHRSPREHLRRGHIRRYTSGLRIFVPATVVNPAVGGRVSKQYRVEQPA